LRAAALLPTAVAARSQQGACTGLRQGQRNECQELPETSARGRCLKDADESQDDYRHEHGGQDTAPSSQPDLRRRLTARLR